MKRFPEVEDLVLKVFKNDMISISILEAEDDYVEHPSYFKGLK